MTCKGECLRERKNELDLTYEKIADRMTAILGKPVSKAAVGHWHSGETGIPYDYLEAFVTAHELKMVDSAEICVPHDTFKSLKSMAKLGIDHL